jgi:hypothetical protein
MLPLTGLGTYRADDVTLLLAEIAGYRPSEYEPSQEYLAMFQGWMRAAAPRIAFLCAVLAEKLLVRRRSTVVLVSIARAGIPTSVVVKRWLAYRHGIDAPHYSLSVIGPRADHRALLWLCRRHDPGHLAFVDGWTSKGTVQAALAATVSRLNIEGLQSSLAVVADPGGATDTFATRADVLIPSACLGAAVSGLLSAPTADPALVAAHQFHGVTVYTKLLSRDLTNAFIDVTTAQFARIRPDVRLAVHTSRAETGPDNRGRRYALALARRQGARDLHQVAVGISESTRAFFRRRPSLLIVNPRYPDAGLGHVLQLAEERNVPTVEAAGMPFQAAVI